MNATELSVVLPAYEEAESLKQILPALKEVASGLTPHFELRRKAILAYSSQFRPRTAAKRSNVFIPLDTLEDNMNLLARHFGNLIGVKYGEPFLQKELHEIDDIVELPVRSF